MGQEIRCRAQHGGEAGEGTALLESAEILFRGEIRFRIPFASLLDTRVTAGRLVLRTSEGRTTLELGDRAAAWAAKIRNPPTVLDKWGLKAGQRVGLVGWTEDDLPGTLAGRDVLVVTGRALRGCDLILWWIDGETALERLPRLRAALKPAGGLWCVYPKGNRDYGEARVRAAARAYGLVDVKVAAVSATHSSLKLVIPKSER